MCGFSGGGVEEIVRVVVDQWVCWADMGVGGSGVQWLGGGPEDVGDVSGDLLEDFGGLCFAEETGSKVV